MAVKVSVIVPVYNPGPYIGDCIDSLLRQSLPHDEYEVVFVDDGSTDETPARLDALAAEHRHVRVIHQENSGWSGRPRNVGIAAAEGEFVMFLDNDDYLGDEALERMYDYGTANGADVVVGKMAGKGRPVPLELFRENNPRATVEDALLVDSLTPHKMVRREFLDRIGLRFPEGRRRLEDHVFMIEAYLRADNVSVLSDYVCYYHVRRDDASNAGFQRFDPVGYFKNLREALDVVERYTEPGPLRDSLFRRWLRVEMLERMRGQRLLALPEDYRRELVHEIRAVVAERFGPGVAAELPSAHQVVAELIAADRLDDVAAFAEWEVGVKAVAVSEAVEWQNGILRVDFTAEYLDAGEPVAFPVQGSTLAVLDTPPQDFPEAVEWLRADIVNRFDEATVDLVVRERSSAAQYFQPIEVTHEVVPATDAGQVRLVLRATATIDPATAMSGTPLDRALWDVFVRVNLVGWGRECRLVPASGPAPVSDPAPDRAPERTRPQPCAGVVGGRVVLPYWTKAQDSLALDVDLAVKGLGLGRLAPADVTVEGDLLRATLPLYVPADTKAVLRLTDPESAAAVEVPSTLSAAEGPVALLEAVLPTGDLTGVTWRPAVDLTPDADEPRFLALPLVLRRTADGVEVTRPVRPVRPVQPSVPAVRPGAARRLARRVRRVLGRALRKAAPKARARLRRRM
jgi:poly(ribitol-phosphate) beta-N-acetylglucosaminyltransferase